MADSVKIKITGDDSDFRAKMEGLGGIAKKGAAAVVAAFGATAIASVKAYAEYEQLVGGVETLFKSSSGIVLDYANNAYKTAGMSANEYMDTVTGFSASLLQSLGGDTDKAAKKADLAITDMADNANKMGTSMESIQYAYQGFAKQNYTMLDNLKLGYGGTKEEMQRLLDDAEKISGIHYDISSYADVVDAIHVVQTEMGITGTTAKEAGDTIQGSMKAAKSAFENFLTGMADEDADMGVLVDNLVDTVVTALKNIVPRIIETIPRLIEGFGKVFDELVGYLPESIQKVIEVFKKIIPVIGVAVAAMYAWKAGLMISGVISAFSKSIKIATGVISMYSKGATVSTMMTTGFSNAQKIMGTIVAVATGKIKLAEVAQWAWNAAISANPIGLIIAAIVVLVAIIVVLWNKCDWFRNAVMAVWEALKTAFSAVIDFIVAAFEKVKEWLSALWDKTEWLRNLLAAAFEEVKEMISAWVSVWVAAFQLIVSAIQLMWEGIKAVWDFISPYLLAFWEVVKTIFFAALEIIKGFFLAAWEGIKLIWSFVQPYFQALWDGIVLIFSVVVDFFRAIFETAWNAIKFVWDTATGYFRMIWENIKLVFSVVAAVLSGDFSAAWDGIKAIWNNVVSFFLGIWEGIKGVFAPVISFFSETWQGAFNAVKSFFTIDNFKKVFEDTICGGLRGVIESVKTAAGEVWDGIQAAFNKTIKLFFGFGGAEGEGYATEGGTGSLSPFNSGRISSAYGVRRKGGKVHTGIDFASPIGTPIQSTTNGVVAKVANLGGKSYGKYVVVRDNNGYSHYYAHMSKQRVSEGMPVGRGMTIGYVGSTGNSTGPHLHYEVRRPGGGHINPQPWWKGARGYATGGFPSIGELFFANENGIEMMGKMGKKNVIANNMQIVDGIRQGMFSGMVNFARAKGKAAGNVTTITQEMHFHKENESPSDLKRAARKGVKMGLAGGIA